MVEHRVGEFFVIERNQFLFEVEWRRDRGTVFFVGFIVRGGFFLDGKEDSWR